MNDEADHDLAERDLADCQRRFAAGDLEAFEQLFRRFKGAVYGWTMRIVRDHAAAEDVTVEAFWRAWRSRGRYDPARPFAAWVRRIAVNLAVGHVEHARPSTEL